MESTSKRATTSSVQYTFFDEDERDWEGETVKKTAGKKKKEEKLKTVVCKICRKKYTDREGLRRHMELHKDTLDYTCEICNSSFKTRGYLVRHQKLVHGPRTHECEFCGKRFPMSHKLDQHRLVHTGEKPHKCEVCGKTFRARYSLNTHVLTHTNEKPYKCQYCPYACRDNSTLRRHHERHTGTLKWYECPYCDKKYYNRTLLKNHVAERHFDTDLKVIPCPQCFGKFKTPGALNRHIKIVHERALRVKCEVCGQEVADKNNMASHMRKHIQLRPYKCKFKKCRMKFKDMSSLKKHSLIHKPTEQHSCEVCGKLFARRNRLNVHMKRHGDDSKINTKFKIMFCDYCGFSYDSKQCLVRHMLKHIRHRNTYVCDVCKFVTHRKLSIEKHMKYGHGDEDDRYCKICDKSYKLHAYLILHYYNRHGIRYKTVKNIKLETSVTIKEEPQEPVPDAEVDLEEIQKQEPLAEIITDVALDCDATDLSYSKAVLSEDIRRSVSNAQIVSSPNGFRRRLKGRAALIDDQNTLYARKEKDVRKKINKLLARVRYKRWTRVLEKARRQYNERIRAMTAKKVDRDNNIKVKFVNINQSNNNETKETDQSGDNNRKFKDNTKNKTILPHETDKDADILRKNGNIHANTEKGGSYVSDNGSDKEDNITDNDEIDTDTVSLATDNEINRVRNVYEDLLDIEENPVGPTETNDLEDTDANSHDENAKVDNSNNIDGYEKDSEVDIKYSVIIYDNIRHHIKEINLNNSELSISKEIIEEDTETSYISNEKENSQSKERNIDNSNVCIGVDKTADSHQEKDRTCEKDNKDEDTEGERGKSAKLKINTHQCYICYKLYETKEKLLEHCQVHFDVCSDVALKRCPLCDYVTERQITRHIKLVHGVNVKLPYYKFNDNSKNTEDKSRYYYNIDDKVVNEIEIIPSVKNLNKIAYVEIDKKNRKSKDLSVAKTKLVKKSGEWLVERENMNVSNEFILPEFDKKEIKRIKQLGDDYLDIIKALGRLAKRHKAKMLFPCNGCDKMCQSYAALKLHSRRHESNPKPFKKKVWKHKLKGSKELKAVKTRNNRKIQTTQEVRQAKPKPIENKHKCAKELMEFYEKNVKGADIEFWQFLKIYNRMNKDHAESLKDLKETNEFGDYVTEDGAMNVEEAIDSQNVKRVTNIIKPKVRNKFTRKLILSKEERLKRARIKEQLRRKITES